MYPLRFKCGMVTVVLIIGLQACAQPPIRERDHAYAIPGRTPKRIYDRIRLLGLLIARCLFSRYS